MSVLSEKQRPQTELLDLELDHLPQGLRWREWMNRVEAVIFTSSKPVGRDDLTRVVGRAANIDLIIEDIQQELKSRPYELVATGGGWMHRCFVRSRITSRFRVRSLRRCLVMRLAVIFSIDFGQWNSSQMALSAHA